jgi:hypothetical protein
MLYSVVLTVTLLSIDKLTFTIFVTTRQSDHPSLDSESKLTHYVMGWAPSFATNVRTNQSFTSAPLCGQG